jgi:hypothetical protein
MADWNAALLNCNIGDFCDAHLEGRWHMNYLNYKHGENWKYKCLILNYQFATYDITGHHKTVQYLCVVSRYQGIWSLIETRGPDPKYPKKPLPFQFSNEKTAIKTGSDWLLKYWKTNWQGREL